MSLPRRTSEQMGEDSARWVAARRAGQTVAQIAAAAGASAATVSRATSAHGPFPVLHRATEQEREAWVAARRGGSTPEQIAAGAVVRVSAWTVARVTAPFGPFPTPPVRPRWSLQDVARWVELRRRRVPLTRIVNDENRARGRGGQSARVTVEMVKAATREAGPFPTPLLGPPGLIGVRAVAELAQVSQPTIAHRRARGQLPEPRVITSSGRALWHPDDIRAWLQWLDLPQCEVCGAKARRLDRHHAIRHAAR